MSLPIEREEEISIVTLSQEHGGEISIVTLHQQLEGEIISHPRLIFS